MGSLVERLQQLQGEKNALEEALEAAWRWLPYNPETAHSEFVKADGQSHELSQAWEQWLQDWEDETGNSGDFRALKEGVMLQLEQFLTQGKGQALMLMGKLDEAQQTFERTMAAPGDNTHPSNAALAEALGQVTLQQAKYEEAEHYFSRAHDEHLQFAIPDAWKDLVDSADAAPSARLSLEGAARTRGCLAQVALQQGDRALFLRRQLEAVEFAKAHNLYDLAKSLWLNLYSWELQWDARGRLSDELEKRLRELEQELESSERVGLEIDKLLLDAENSIARNSKAKAKRRLNEARGILAENSHLLDKRWALCLAFAAFHEWRDEIEEAIDHAESALAVAQQIGMPDLIQQATAKLVDLSHLDAAKPEHKNQARRQIDKTIEMLSQVKAGEALAQALIQRAMTFYLPNRQYEAALADIGEAEAHVKLPDLRRLVSTSRAVVLKMSDQKAEALSEILKSIELCREQMLPRGRPSARSYRDLLHQTETLHEAAALLAADLGRAHEAFDWAEEGKTRLLRLQLVQSGRAPRDDTRSIPRMSYDEGLRRSLQGNSVAFLYFCVGTGRTLALLLDPQEAAPLPLFVDLKEADLHRSRLAKELWPASGAGDGRFLQFLSYLSDKLLKPIGDVLQDVMNRCEVLYIVPDSRLYLVPFSALTLNGEPLVEHEHCALALAPSVALWHWCCERRPKERERNCLAVGVGRAGEFSFADQARATMAGCNWAKTPRFLLDDEESVTSERVWKAAKEHTVVHFSCHGMEEPTTLDTLSALHLELSNHEKWRAKDIFDHNDELSSELIFLNACMSGRYRLQEGVAIGGFWEAFLHAGASSIIGTLAEVHPEDAEFLARSFYQIWLQEDIPKARALQRAQQALRQKRPGSFHWARYVLVGDHH